MGVIVTVTIECDSLTTADHVLSELHVDFDDMATVRFIEARPAPYGNPPPASRLG